ncbi:unnamed protein product [Aphis gossypii]|uniref:Uncharacterized protein n=1 Tax=Aphis gossypii TaxID=80765 RepID=A0A9P0J977_APHGO|nr:unnamed protein product [Aphis gossypii]
MIKFGEFRQCRRRRRYRRYGFDLCDIHPISISLRVAPVSLPTVRPLFLSSCEYNNISAGFVHVRCASYRPATLRSPYVRPYAFGTGISVSRRPSHCADRRYSHGLPASASVGRSSGPSFTWHCVSVV